MFLKGWRRPGRAKLGPSWGQEGDESRLEAILESLGAKMDIIFRSTSFALLFPILNSMTQSWPHLGPSWGQLGPSWGPSWAHLGALAASLGRLGSLLGALGRLPSKCFGHLP